MSSKKCILCVEGDADTCDLLSALLGRDYDETTTVSVTDTAHRHEASPLDLYILDSECADGGGVGLCRHIRRSGQTAPVVNYSGRVLPERMEEATRSGATE